MASNPVCIRRASTVEEAAIIVNWLGERDVEAVVVDPDNPSVMAFGITDPEGIEIYVKDRETADRAKALLAEHDAERVTRSAADAGQLMSNVTCESCGHVNSFEDDVRGAMQECSKCGAFLDLPQERA